MSEERIWVCRDCPPYDFCTLEQRMNCFNRYAGPIGDSDVREHLEEAGCRQTTKAAEESRWKEEQNAIEAEDAASTR